MMEIFKGIAYFHAGWPTLAMMLALGLAGCLPPNAFYTVTAIVEPAGSGHVAITPDESRHFAGTEVRLKAVPNDGWEFVEWLATDLSTTTETETTFAIFDDKTVVCRFQLINDPVGNRISDPGFEEGPESLAWDQSSLNFAALICDDVTCGRVNDIGPHTGKFWAYLGGAPEGNAEISRISQTVTMPGSGEATLQFHIAVPLAGDAFEFRTSIGGTTVYRLKDDDVGHGFGYRLITLDASRFANGDESIVAFEYDGPALFGGTPAVFLDDVILFDGRVVPEPGEGEGEGEGEGSAVVISISPAMLPNAFSGQFYSYSLTANGGLEPYRWEVVDEADLPTGFVLTSGGTIRGLALLSGHYTFGVRVTDANKVETTEIVTLTIE